MPFGPLVCYECGGELHVGDIQSIRVIDNGGAGEVVYDSDPETAAPTPTAGPVSNK